MLLLLPSEIQWYLMSNFLSQHSLVMLKRTCKTLRTLIKEKFKPQYSELEDQIKHDAHLDFELITERPLPIYSELIELISDKDTFKFVREASEETEDSFYRIYQESAIEVAVKLGFPLDEKRCEHNNNSYHQYFLKSKYFYNAGKYDNRYIIDTYGKDYDNYNMCAWGASSEGNIELLRYLISKGAQYTDMWLIYAQKYNQKELAELLIMKLQEAGKYDLNRIEEVRNVWSHRSVCFTLDI